MCVLQNSERLGGGDLGGSGALVGGRGIGIARIDGEVRSKGSRLIGENVIKLRTILLVCEEDCCEASGGWY